MLKINIGKEQDSRTSEQQLNLFIADNENSSNAAIRIFNADGRQVFYASSRLGTIKHVDEGYLIGNINEFIGMNYELKKIKSGKVIKGRVTHNVMNFPDSQVPILKEKKELIMENLY